ncbi:MAG: carbohydrate porin [bacterium]|nr:carbohydrate porin [bacterium]
MKRLFFIFLLLLVCFPAIAIEEEQERFGPFSLEAIKQSPYLFDYKGLRGELEAKGINIQSSYLIDSFVMRNRSKRSAKGTYQGLYNLSLELDTEKLNWYKGGRFFILYQVGNSGINSMDYLGTYSDVNSFDPMRSINQISELYYEHSFKDDLFNIKVGKQDANMDFQALDTGFNFLNLAFSFIDNTPMPLFPSQQMGVRARVKFPHDIYVQNGFYDGNLAIGANPKSFFTGSNNYFNISEVYKQTNIGGKEGKYLVGSWIKTGKYDAFSGSEKRNNYGIYGGIDQKIINRFEDKSGGVNLFGQFGYARRGINDVPYYFGVGAVLNGVTQKRKKDAIGIAFGWHQFDKQLKKAENMTSEKVIELFYKIQLTNFLYIQPDFQYIIKPGGNTKDSFAIGIRSGIAF